MTMRSDRVLAAASAFLETTKTQMTMRLDRVSAGVPARVSWAIHAYTRCARFSQLAFGVPLCSRFAIRVSVWRFRVEYKTPF